MRPRERCGIVGAYSLGECNILSILINGSRGLQHRGQESWGIAVGDKLYKDLGLVPEVYEETLHILEKMRGRVGIGHVRYSTKGRTTVENAHPIEIRSSKMFFMAHNGTISNVEELSRSVRDGGYDAPEHATDTELMGLRLSQILERRGDWFEAFQLIHKELNGSYSLVILTDSEELVAARDERGFRPLCLGWHEESKSYVIVSESCALDYLHAEFMRDIEPGEIIKIDGGGLQSHRFSEAGRHAHCPFEYTYFAHPSSYIEGRSVYQARKNIGRELARKYKGDIEGDITIPIPDSARPGALGFSEESGVPFEEGLMKDRYRRKGSLRSFIEPGRRVEIVREMIPIRSAIEGRDVVVIDDSIVRGTTSREVVRRLKDSGAKKIQWYVIFPPIAYPCYMGIDFPTREELLVPRICKGNLDLGEVNEQAADHLGVDFLGYNDVEGLSRGIDLPKSELCLACTTGDYSCLRQKPRFKTREEMKGS